MKIAVEVISPSDVKTDRSRKWVNTPLPEFPGTGRTAFAGDLPIRIQLDWDQLSDLVL
ncbi:hypothetical protein [Nocardia abscessus]|uniref:hypothetical protein n=1 Tax=Nocardia abscessus TaxID=120957 RepID=UPI00245483C6|nr:hypothetical protein [Nocardia abscessus]